MDFKIEKIFLPSSGVDIVFDLNSLTPFCRTSIIYDIDLKKQTIIVAQPLIPLTKSTQFSELHLTIITQDEKRKLRAGVECRGFKLISNYPLANKTNVPAILLSYKTPVLETNIRSAYRLILGSKYTVKCKFALQGLQYSTPYDFTVKDISLSGLGALFPRKKPGTRNIFAKIKADQKVSMRVALINSTLKKPMGILDITAAAKRIRPEYTLAHSLIGFHFKGIKLKEENLLNQFVHEAQVDELKKLSRQD